MTYQALARKYRPRNFGELVGQEHVLRALVNALDNNRLHHAFLFTGTRGVGKTTIARILAKSLNCETGVSSKPCGECSACREIDEGRFVDLIEVDAASRTKVDDTRELLDNVQYAPTRGRYKVYLVDEVHMLSNHSFNALLKTLEEPPPHVKFLFATTDPQKLPVTILSRCLQFSLKRLPTPLIIGHLDSVLGQENVERDESAIALLARAAEGSMRDALSLMDQAIAFGGGELRDAEVRAMLGTIDKRHVVGMLKALAVNDGGGILAQIGDLDSQAPDYKFVGEELAVLLQRVARVQTVPKGTEDWEDIKELKALAEQLPPEDVQLFYQIVVTGLRDVAAAPDARSAFEMLMLRLLAFRPMLAGEALPSASTSSAPSSSPPGEVAAKKAEPVAPVARPAETTPETAAAPDEAAVAEPAAERAPHADSVREDARRSEAKSESSVGNSTAGWKDPDWHSLVDALGLSGVAHQLAMNCSYSHRQDNVLHLNLAQQHEQMVSARLKERLEQALSRFYQEPLKISLHYGEPEDETPAQRDARRQAARLEAAKESLRRDPTVRAMQETFGASLNEDSVRPLD